MSDLTAVDLKPSVKEFMQTEHSGAAIMANATVAIFQVNRRNESISNLGS